MGFNSGFKGLRNGKCTTSSTCLALIFWANNDVTKQTMYV